MPTRLYALLLSAVVVLGSAACAAPAEPVPSPTAAADARYAACVKGATDDYRVTYGEPHYRDNVTAVDRLISKRCETARK